MPQASTEGGLQNSEMVKELRSLCDQVETIKAERDAIEASIKDSTFDMGMSFILKQLYRPAELHSPARSKRLQNLPGESSSKSNKPVRRHVIF